VECSYVIAILEESIHLWICGTRTSAWMGPVLLDDSFYKSHKYYWTVNNIFLVTLRYTLLLYVPVRIQYCSGAGAPRHDQRRFFYVDTVIDSRYLEMDVVREREGEWK